MKRLYVLFFLICAVISHAQRDFVVYLKDKGTSTQMLPSPESFLTKRAILRKQAHNIPVDASDLPLCGQYVSDIISLLTPSDKVLLRSKWLNAVIVQTNETTAAEIEKLPFVLRVAPYIPNVPVYTRTQSVNHGLSRSQIEMLKGEFLHQQGFLGQGILIAVFDGGFFNANTMAVFDTLFQSGRVKLTFNFNNNSSNIYFPGSHGTSVLGVMASYLPGQMVGSAPKADYILLQTEFEPTETRQEEYNWLAAAELSDSMGVDIINSSLGYNTFDNPADNYTISQLDGHTAIVTQAAIWAARKGILVVNSAGNEGNTSWRKILFPADADSILAVGGVNSARQRVNFSSMGPTADNRIKPDVAAQAFQTITVNSSGNATTANGTSFSAPLISGLAACLWQAYPHKNFFEIRNAIMQSGHQAADPDTLLGFGIPDFQLAAQLLLRTEEHTIENQISLFPVPTTDMLKIKTHSEHVVSDIRIFDGYGRCVLTHATYPTESGINVSDLPAGMYFITFETGGATITKKFVKH